MSKKRFTFGAVSPNVAMIKDNGEPMDIGEVVDKLNELAEENNILNKNEDDLKECTIENIKLQEENEKLRKSEKINMEYAEQIVEENHKFRIAKNELEKSLLRKRKKVGEQQATIRQLQDLCGQSDGENAKLRIENKRLRAENEKLRFALRAEQALAKIQKVDYL